ncbi:MAG TPA: hypothetical protein VMS96_05365 [Terriglobales bacterium]|nr:hypothetical protein [Terriglobales bacterium]
MKNINDVIRAKEQQVQQLQRELEVLRSAARLLADDTDAAPAPRPASASNVATPMVMRPAQPAAPVAAPAKESGAYVAPSAWDASKPQFP